MALALWACDSRPVPQGPDVVIITVDTLRVDRLGFAGHAEARTPILDDLAGRGRVFTEATTPLPRTTPALASMLTGVRPPTHGSREVGQVMSAVIPTLASTLHAQGWETIGLSGTPVAGPAQGLDRGFEDFVVDEDPRAQTLVDRALDLVDDVDDKRPILLWIHLVDPHFPYLPGAGSPQPEARTCRKLGERAQTGALKRYRLFTNQRGVASGALRDCQALYDAEVTAVDTAIGHLESGLDARRDRERLVVFTADHGENMGEGALFYEHGPDVHDASLRVPMVWAGPGVQPGVDGGLATLQDVTPTILAAAGIPAPQPMDGVDLLGGVRPEVAVAESGSALHAKLTGYLRSGRGDRRSCVNGPRFSLCSDGFFDHTQDPDLKQDLGDQHPARRAALEAAAQAWPPEQARQLTARTAQWKLTATPTLEGGYSTTLTKTGGWGSSAEATDHASANPALVQTLWAAIEQGLPDRVSGQAPPSASRDAAAEEQLRQLGYIE